MNETTTVFDNWKVMHDATEDICEKVLGDSASTNSHLTLGENVRLRRALRPLHEYQMRYIQEHGTSDDFNASARYIMERKRHSAVERILTEDE